MNKYFKFECDCCNKKFKKPILVETLKPGYARQLYNFIKEQWGIQNLKINAPKELKLFQLGDYSIVCFCRDCLEELNMKAVKLEKDNVFKLIKDLKKKNAKFDRKKNEIKSI